MRTPLYSEHRGSISYSERLSSEVPLSMKTVHLACPDKCFRDFSVPASRACGDEVSHSTALQECVHVVTSKVDLYELPHLQEAYADDSCFGAGTVSVRERHILGI